MRRTAKITPLLIVFDDMHWADLPTVELLDYVLRQLDSERLLLVAAQRERESDICRVLAAMRRPTEIGRVDLRGLDLHETSQLLTAVADEPPTAAVVAEAFERTGGNPFYPTELARHGVGEVPVTVQGWVGGRLRRLPAPVADALSTAALLGPHFPLRQLAAALGEPAAATLETLQRAVDSGILVVTPEDSDHYAFLHAIVAEAIVARTPHAERVRRHARIAEALVALTGHEAVDAASVVRHLLPARPLLGDETLSLYSIRAGHEALATYSYRDARNHLAKGLAEGQHFLSDDERASAQFALARADSALENWDEVRIQLQTVFDYYVSAGRGEEAATAASFPMSVMTCATDIYEFCHGLVDDAKQLVDKASLAAGRLACWEAACVHWTSGDLGVCRDRLDVARRLAGRHGDRRLELRSTYYRGFIEKMGGDYVAGSALSAQAAQLARDMGDVHLEILSRASAAYSAADLGRDCDRDEHEERALALLQRATDPRVARQTVFLAKPHWGAGRVDRARQLSDAGLSFAPHEAFLVWDRAKREADFAPRQVSYEWLERLRGALRVAEVGLGLPEYRPLTERGSATAPTTSGWVGSRPWMSSVTPRWSSRRRLPATSTPSRSWVSKKDTGPRAARSWAYSG